jgi:simple sugar transport system substrate-binding protein
MSDRSEGMDRAAALKWLAGLAAGGTLAGSLPGVADAAATSFLRPHPHWRFVFVNHATTNPFFVPTRFGIEDACSLVGARFTWTGSSRSDVGQMVNAMRRAIKERAAGIAISLIEPTAFNRATADALAAGIPVIAYNADGGRGNQRLAYVGQDLYESGLKFGARIAKLVEGGDVLLFIATPGQLNIQPRIDGARDAIRDSGKPIRARIVATGPNVRQELRKIERTYLEHKGVRGMFAVDGGSTAGVAAVMRKHNLRAHGVKAGGYDLLVETLRGVGRGDLDFTIDQQPYLQGFVPLLQLFLAKYSGGLVSPADTNTGLVFVTRKNVGPYLTTFTRYEGSSGLQKYPVGSYPLGGP